MNNDPKKVTPYRFTNQHISREINALDIKVFEQIDYLARSSRRKGGVGFAYPSQNWIADRLAYRRESINRSIRRLCDQGILIKRKVRLSGRWARCRYWVHMNPFKQFLRAWRQTTEKRFQRTSPCDSTSTLTNTKRREILSEGIKDIDSIFSRKIMERWTQLGLIK